MSGFCCENCKAECKWWKMCPFQWVHLSIHTYLPSSQFLSWEVLVSVHTNYKSLCNNEHTAHNIWIQIIMLIPGGDFIISLIWFNELPLPCLPATLPPSPFLFLCTLLHPVLPPTHSPLSLSLSHPLPCLSLSLCFRALQCWCLGDDVCDVADRVGCGCVCVWVLQPGGLQSLSGRWARWGDCTHTHTRTYKHTKAQTQSIHVKRWQWGTFSGDLVYLKEDLVAVFGYLKCTIQTEPSMC